MASRLYAWARWMVRRRRWVIATWIVLLAVVGGLGATLHGKRTTEFTVPGVEAQQAQDLLKEKFPPAAGGVVRVVVAAPEGKTVTDPAQRQALDAALHKAASVPGVVTVSQPTSVGAVSADRTIAYSDVRFAEEASKVEQSAKDELSTVMQPLRDAGMQVELGGSAMLPESKAGGPAELVGVVLAFVILAVALGSVVAAGLPLVTALLGVAVGVLGTLFVSGFVQMTGTATVLALMIGLAVGIDYALFVISRHREQLSDPETDWEESIARATATAGSAVVFAGATVVIALAALAITGIPFLTIMGLAGAGTVLIAVLVAISLLPAVLGVFGERMRPRRPQRKSKSKDRPAGAWGLAWARTVTRKPALVLLVGIVGLLALALPARDLRLGLPSYASQPEASTQHKSYDLLTEGFGPGFNATLITVVDTEHIPQNQRQATVTRLRGALAADENVAAVSRPVSSPSGGVVVMGVAPKSSPDAQATTDLVHRMRDRAPEVADTGGALYVTGQTAMAIDVAGKLGDALPLFLGIIVILALILLAIAFRSILVPLKAALGFLLSVGASLGASVWVFQQGHLNGLLDVAAIGPVTSFLPVLLTGVLFGLAMDYEVFLVSRMREHYEHSKDPAEAIAQGVSSSARVVVAAALIMVAVFGGFVFNEDPIVKAIGFALAIGVFIDAFVVRMTLVPAAMALLGRRAWRMPRRLDRLLPDVDIEGARLPASAPAVPAANPHTEKKTPRRKPATRV
ncbi:MMPL family transporter [Streptomyces sp. TLI_105]|uniref:MMPL family transporter n=1 Tax=Streptomyces sp. TLI_105 TaxID=1881019 RepID=UPI00089D2994|nr:MMPL family transporter [Streptomyces sp. TLI_105]SEB62234.1 putative drug exporter of the RND superfamily [Streptomyces sp. TLI_105]